MLDCSKYILMENILVCSRVSRSKSRRSSVSNENIIFRQLLINVFLIRKQSLPP